MKANYFIFLMCFLLISTISYSQKEIIDEKFTNYYKEPVKHFDNNVKINIKNIISRYNFFKFAFNLENITNDFIIYDNSKSKLILDWGETVLGKSKHFFLKPKQNVNEVFDVSGDTRFIREKVKFVLNGLVRVSSKGNNKQINNLKLEDSNSIIKHEDYEISIKKKDIKAKKSNVVLTVVNVANNYLIVKPTELSVSVSESISLKNETILKKDILIAPGEHKNININFNLDENLDYINYIDKTILFNKFLSVSIPVKLDALELTFEVDRETTYRMNK